MPIGKTIAGLSKAAAKVFLVVLAVPLAILCWLAYSTGTLLEASDLRVSDPVAAVHDARQLIEDFRASEMSAERDSQRLPPGKLPVSLRIPRLKCAFVYRDHLNLIVGRNPDLLSGARVWSTDATTAHADQPTAYQDIFFFKYCNDLPTSPGNPP